MNDLLVLLIGVAAGTYFADGIRPIVPLLDPNGEK